MAAKGRLRSNPLLNSNGSDGWKADLCNMDGNSEWAGSGHGTGSLKNTMIPSPENWSSVPSNWLAWARAEHAEPIRREVAVEIPQAHGRREDRSDDLSPLVFGQCCNHCPDSIEVTADFFNRAGELVKQRPALYQDQAAAPHRSRVPTPKAGARPGPQPPANKPRPPDDSPEEDPTSPPARGNSGRLIPHPIPI